MDERHWWIAGKIQESFRLGNPALLEDFLRKEITLAKVNAFLKAGGPCRLFFYSAKSNGTDIAAREIHCTGNLTTLRDADLGRITILYFLRNKTDTDVDPSKMERDIFCGELKHNAIETLSSLLADIYMPLIQAQKCWGHCSEDDQANLMLSMDKYVTALNEISSTVSHSRQMQVLRQPESVTEKDFKMQRTVTFDPQIIHQYEELICEWMNTIETILCDTSDEGLLDLNAGPLSELEKWKRRHRLLTGVTEQLKGKECKTVLTALITAKSKQLKRWKIVDASITDGLNDTKDKVRYLESLKRHFDQLYQNASPSQVINTTIPGLVNSIKQMDSVSRFYARTGFLGILFTRVTNQLVQVCKDQIKQYTYSAIEDKDELWDRIAEEVISYDPHSQGDPHIKSLSQLMENKLQEHRAKNIMEARAPVDDLCARLQSCLTLQTFYKESLYSVREALIKSQNQSRLSSVSSFTTVSVSVKKDSIASGPKPNQHSPHKKGLYTPGHGVPISDEKAIMTHLDTFCSRVCQVLEVISTLSQFTKMIGSLVDVPHPRKEDLIVENTSELEHPINWKPRGPQQEQANTENDDENDSSEVNIVVTAPQDSLLYAITEDEEQAQNENADNSNTDINADHRRYPEATHGPYGLSEQELSVLKKYYHEDEDVDGPSVSTIVEQHIRKMKDVLKGHVTTKTMLDVESKDKDKFDSYYHSFQNIVQDLEIFLGAYLHITFVRKMEIQKGLDIITRFSPIASRSGIRGAIAEKYVIVFEWFESELAEVQKLYERQKEHPEMMRNAPPIAGGIHWSRQLLKRIEEPMKIFWDNKAVTSLADFGNQVRIYNRLATALVTFESLWFTQWKRNIEQGRNGLQATLFVLHPETGEIVVNFDDKVLELIHEAKWMTRLGIQIPDSALSVIQQEGRYKSYKSHLELALKDFREVCQSVPDPLLKLFNSHIEHVHQQFQPGLSVLAWNSLNIDAFLHQIHSATEKLQKLKERVTQVMNDKVNNVICTIQEFCLFDTEIAFSHTWSVSEFHAEMLKSITERSVVLRSHVETILEGLQTITEILTKKKVYGLSLKNIVHIHAVVMSKIRKVRQNSKNKTYSFKPADNKKTMKEKKLDVILSDEKYGREKEVAAEEEANVREFTSHLREQVLQAVLCAVTKSLACLADASGCTGEVIRAYTSNSNQETQSERNSPSPRAGNGDYLSASPSRVNSVLAEGRHSAASERPVSHMTSFSEINWLPGENVVLCTPLKFEVSVKFSIPKIITEPTLDVVQKTITDTANSILGSVREISWTSENNKESFYDMISRDSNVLELHSQLTTVVDELHAVVNKHLFHFSYYNFLWKDDMHGNFNEFIMADPGEVAIKREVERCQYLDKKVLGIPSRLSVGPVSLCCDPIKDSLHSFSMAWKTNFASVLHENAKKKLDSVVSFRETVKSRLEHQVQTLDHLNSVLHLLEELRDMENKIDGHYLPIETMYAKLREFELRLPRQEVEEVDCLRDKWCELLILADQVREVLLKERREAFEQELDKQVKTFVVEVIQFRNAFDAQGPAVPGIQPTEAVSRLHDFQHRFSIYNTKRKTLDSISKLFSIPCKSFPELDKTGEELDLLSLLYGLFQKFIYFDSKFRDTLWAEVDLGTSSTEVEGYWDECLALPSKLKDWDAYSDLKTKLKTYSEVFPLLQKLSSKEIRNRHWLQVMQVTHSSFPLEGNIFKLSYLMDIALIKHKAEVEEICKGAGRELELEVKMRMTEEEWTEQALNFEHYKKRGPIFLDKTFTERLLEQLEDAEALLASMLTSRYIGPLRDEASSWAEKLKEVADVLELWLEVQDLWHYLEAVFSNPLTARELPQEAQRFTRIDKGWTKMMKRAFDTRNVLQCCYGGETLKAAVLSHIHEELEICFKSLVGYLDKKRQTFPRFYFVSDPVLLALLSQPNDLDSVRPHLKSVFSAIADVKLEKTPSPTSSDADVHTVPHIRGVKHSSETSSSQSDQINSPNSLSTLDIAPPKIDKRLHQHYNLSPGGLLDSSSMLPSEGIVSDTIVMDATAVLSADGEVLNLSENVTLTGGVEVWLKRLMCSVGETLRLLNKAVIIDCQNGIPLEEWVLKYPSQVCHIGMLYHWTAECETAIAEIKYEKKALQGALRKYSLTTSRLAAVLLRGIWKNSDEPVLPVHCQRIEAMITQSSYLRDILENLGQRKLRETTDFEWRRSVRCYCQPDPTRVQQESEQSNKAKTATVEVPCIWILDSHYEYGTEFYGTELGAAPTSVTEKCFLVMSLALRQMTGTLLVGPPGSRRIETVKGLASILGNFMATFQVSEEYSSTTIGKIAQGMAMDGCWVAFDEVQNLSRHGLSVLLDCVQSIFQALRAKESFMCIIDGTEIPLCRTAAMFLSVNLSHTTNRNLPSDLIESFRVISLVKPDPGMFLKAKCSSMGFRAPAMLASRLKLLTELVKDQLPSEIQHHFSTEALIGALRRAMQKKQKEKEDKMADRNMKDEASRSESQSSETATNRNTQATVNVLTNKLSQTGISYKPGTASPLTALGKQDHAAVGEALDEIIRPRLTSENQTLFRIILKDCFSNLPKPDTTKSQGKEHRIQSAKMSGALSTKTLQNVQDIESTLVSKAVESGLAPHKPWITKCSQLYTLSQVYNGIIVAGPPGSGKSTCIKNVADALGAQKTTASQTASDGKPSSKGSHRFLRVNPMVVDDASLMFGSLGHNSEWVDGIFTHAVRKANRNLSATWICIDGILNARWADNFSSILTGDKVLHLKNGDKLFLSDRFMLLFETSDLNYASPTLVSSCGILYLDRDVIGWKPIARAWLDTRSHFEAHVLQKAFQKTLDPIIGFVLSEAKPHLQLSEVGLLRTCLALLAAMLADNIEVAGELHVERLYLFCLMWTFGGLLDANDRKAFSDLLKTLSTALPDDDRDICVFDYYVDESGEWDPWHSRVPESVFTDNQNVLGECFVDTVDTIRTRILMEFSAASGRNVLLVGPHGSGKTSIVSAFIDRQDQQISVCKRMVFSGASTAMQLQHFIESNIYHRQGFAFGALDNKKLKVFIDDINLPLPDENGVQRCNELLRQVLDEKQLCTLKKPFEWHTIEDLTVISTMAFSEYPATVNRPISGRLLHHFAVFWLPAPKGDALRSIVHGILEVKELKDSLRTGNLGKQLCKPYVTFNGTGRYKNANMRDDGAPSLDLDLHSAIVSVSCGMLTAIQGVLRLSPIDGCCHYLFTLRDISTCFQCLKRLAHENRADEIMVISLWQHELRRIVRDRICRISDMNWFDEKLDEVISEKWKNIKSVLHENFVTFPLDAHAVYRPVASTGSKQVKVTLQSVENFGDLHSCLNVHLTHYNDEFGKTSLSVMLSDFVISHIVRLHRIFSFHRGGNLLLVGALGLHLSTLCHLVLHIAGIPALKMDTSKPSNFFDGLRSAIRLSGSESKVVSLLFTARDLQDQSYLDAINSLLISGEYPSLFSHDEMDGLLQAIQPMMKREFPGSSMDPMKYFVSRVKSNLHIVVCLQPSHQLLRAAAKNFPGLLTGCQMNWICDWRQEALLNEGSYFIAKHQLSEDFENLRENITKSLANIHSFVLRDCKQLPWAGDVSQEISLTTFTVQDQKKDQLKAETSMVPNLPYSKIILEERIKLNHRDPHIKAKNEIYVGPTTYRRFMESFRHLYMQKAKERTKSVVQLKKVIATLDKTRADARIMKKGIKITTGKFEEAQKKTADLLNKLTAKATVFEKLKAKVGLSKSLDAYLQLNELDVEDDEEDELLKEEEYDEYDAEFDKMREANLMTRGVQAKEELTDVHAKVEECRGNLAHARDQVMFWRSKVDRNVIEHVRAFQNPPMLVGQAIEMILVLVGKRLPPQRVNEVKESHSGKDELSSRMSSSSGNSKLLVKKVKVKDVSERFDKAQWKSMQQTMTDSVKFVDMLHNISWEDGLSSDVLTAVESYLACSQDGQLGVTGEGTLLENAHEKQFPAVKQRSLSPGAKGGLTIAGVKYASEDCATLVHYTIAVVEYSRLCGPLRQALERMRELEREIEESEKLQKQQEQEVIKEEEPQLEEEEEDLSESDLPRIQQEMVQLQNQFDQAVVEKHSFEVELQSMHERLKAAVEMLDSLKSQECAWRQNVKDNDSNELLLANCISAAGILTYCGAVNIDTRRRMGEFFLQVCEHHGLPLHKYQLFRNLELSDFLYTPLDIIRMQLQQLPTSHQMLENSCFLKQDSGMAAWPLVCDPTSRFNDWLRSFYAGKELVEVKYHEIRSQLDSCLSDGIPLLVTDCDMNALMRDHMFISTIQNCARFIQSRSRFKVTVKDHEVECDPGFRLYFHTTSEPHTCPHELAVNTALTFFQLSRTGVEEEFLDIFMAQEKSRLNNEKITLIQEKQENLAMIEKLEQQMRDQLDSDIRLLSSLQATKKLIELKKHFDETQESQASVETREDSIMKAREDFRAIAQRAAVCFDTAQYMREVNPLYQISFKQFVSVYQTAIAHSERASIKAVIDRLTQGAFLTAARGCLEKDRFLYVLLLAIEMESSLGNVSPGEREFVISPDFCSAVMSANITGQTADLHIMQSKKPFDWMTDDQFHNLQILATHFDWFKDMFDRMSKDGRETLWRNLCESEFPENIPLPDKMDDTLSAIQRLCIVRAVRNDKLLPASVCFINRVLGKRYNLDAASDLPTIVKQSTPSLPIILLFNTEAHMTVKIFQDFCSKRQTQFLTIVMTDDSITDDRTVKKQILKAMAEGTWVLLHNAHNSPHLLNAIGSILNEGQPLCDSNFRLWISSHFGSTAIPVHLLQNSVRVYVDSPKAMKDSLIRSFFWMDPDILKQSSRPEWSVMLHNLCYLHAAIHLKTRFGSGGWNLPHEFSSVGFHELQEAVNFSLGEFKDAIFVTAADGSLVPRATSWTGIRYMLSEIVYGAGITDFYDQQSLSAMVDFWCSPSTLKKEFEVARLKYKTPAAFFSPNVRLTTLMQAFDGVSPFCLETPEACHLHPNVETLLGDDQYIFTRLNKVFDAMPASSTLLHQLFPQPPAPFIGPPLAGVSNQSNNPLVVHHGVFSSASHTAYKLNRGIDLWETCHTMLQKLPKVYNKDFIGEKVKKIGGFTPFNNFITRELEIMYKLLSEIRTSLQAIKAATESNVLGDHISQHTLDVADNIYHLQIPDAWRRMMGNSAPPLTYNLAQWLVELQNRCHHFERILTLGREKMPAYWLGAFFNPRGLLALLKQDSIRNYASDKAGSFEAFTFQTEMTSRDKDHLRDPPQEGMFVWGIHVWGCAWDRTTGELQDLPPRTSFAALPVVHVTCLPAGEKPNNQDSVQSSETYQCPVYHSRQARQEVILELDVRKEGIPASRWALRGLSATIRPH